MDSEVDDRQGVDETPEPPGTIEEGGSRAEAAVAIAICAVALVGPLLYFQHRYELFVAQSGGIREGAASATLALAVIFRTVSRTVLRTLVRTSARAGMKASMKGALQTAMRVLFASMMKTTFGQKGTRETDPAALRRGNVKSLLFASGLLYASWVIVVGLGQPFAALHSEAEEVSVEAKEDEEVRAALERKRGPAIEAWKAQREVDRIRGLVGEARRNHKNARALEEQQKYEAELILLAHDENDAKDALAVALVRSNDTVFDPAGIAAAPPATQMDRVLEQFAANAPYPGDTPWSSLVLWLGGLAVVLPLWLTYLAQSGVAKRLGSVLRHETAIDGGVIQLYFAGAFSFMPLTSDVRVEGDDAVQGKVALAGLVAPLLVAVLCWFAWQSTQQAPLLFLADAFLIYPMVQTFPLDPLDGVRVWRWNKLVWFLVFLVVMTGFMLAGSEGLKNVI